MTQSASSGQRLARSGLVMAIGTAASRGTGFLRTVVIAAAMGLTVGDSYNVANTIPNIIYDLLLGGVLTSVVVPLLVKAERNDGDGGQAYAQRLVTIVVATLSIVSVIGVALAPELIRLYTGHRLSPDQFDLATMFARFFLPQVLFYGVGAVYGAILNTRGSFAAPMWAPVLNNLVVIASGALFFAMTTGHPRPGDLSETERLVLAVGTTAGVVLQTIALVPALRRVQFRHRFRFDWRNAGLRSAGAFAGWIVGYVVTNQIGYLVIVKLAIAAGNANALGSGFSPYTYAFILFSLPYAVIAVSVVTAVFPRMSRSAVAGDLADVGSTLATGLTLSATVLVPATVALVALGPLIGTVVFAHGNIGLAGARLIGATLAGFGIGLVPFSAFQIQLRAFLSMHDSRTPALVNLGITALNLVADVVLYVLLPGQDKVVGLAVGFSVSYLAGAVVQAVILRRRLGEFDRPVLRTHVRLAGAAVVAAVPTYVIARLLTAGLGLDAQAAFAASIVAALAGGATFLAVATRMHIDELAEIRRLVRPGVRPG